MEVRMGRAAAHLCPTVERGRGKREGMKYRKGGKRSERDAMEVEWEMIKENPICRKRRRRRCRKERKNNIKNLLQLLLKL